MGTDDFDTSAGRSNGLPVGGEWGGHFTSEQINSVDFGVVASAVADRLRHLAHQREAHTRSLIAERLPRYLRFLLDHPRLLAFGMRVTPERWWPELRLADLTQAGPMTEGAAAVMARTWVITNPNRDGQASYDGLTVRYLDVNCLPAEFHGGPTGPFFVDSVGVLDLTGSGRLTVTQVAAAVKESVLTYGPDFMLRMAEGQLASLQSEIDDGGFAKAYCYAASSDKLTVYGHPVEIVTGR